MGQTRTILNPPSTNGNGRKATTNQYDEIGSIGIESWSGYIRQAYTAELTWPTCYPLFNRIRRSDPEIGGIVRPAFVTLARQTSLDWELPENPSDDDKRAQDYMREVIDDMEGGGNKLLEEMASYVPFMGFGWWEVVMGKRDPNWKPPQDDDWRSEYDDGLPAIRRLAWRDHSSFEHWEMDDKTGRVKGFWQVDPPNQRVFIPLNRSLHLTFGDPNNPEGLSPLEAVYRLESMKYRLEFVEGTGYEHTAGYLHFKAQQSLTDTDKAEIKKAATAVMTAQAQNYLAMPGHVDASILDVDFAAAMAIRQAINHYGILKLQVFNMQWVTMSTTSNSGSYAAVSDSSEMGIMHFNGMMEGFADQIDAQIGKRLFADPQVRAKFPGLTRRPRAIITPIEKVIPLNELSQFVQAISPIVPLDDDDIIAIRRKSGFLPETLPETSDTIEEAPVMPENDQPIDEQPPVEDEPVANMAQGSMVELQASSEPALAIADGLEDEMKDIYLAWLEEADKQLNAADDNTREEVLLGLLVALMTQVRRRVELRAAQLADEYGLDGEALAAMNRQVEQTLSIFESRTINRVETAVTNPDKPILEQTGLASHIALIGGGIWAAYQLAKQAQARRSGVQLEARWTGPDDKGTCPPCSREVALGWRPFQEVPAPGPDICFGLTNCRHDIEYRNVETGAVSLSPEGL